MRLKEIIDSCGHLKVIEQRCIKNDFIDLVFNNEELSEWQRILSSFLGAPRKPKGQQPSRSDLDITSKTGGIRVNQTLFEREFEEGTVIAKFWPWQDGRYTTLRMALLLKGT
ncbi:MAG: hypothetical protein C4519_11815 [Desulfobacteraceae bacterium]|nr:MAG: hypothetical protein C4519_11815 [Desulfobacteraceae bacterium]